MFLVVIGVATAFVACTEHIHYGTNPSARYYLSKAQLEANERDALAGDNEAAKRMADYYYFAKNDRANCIWWFKLAASRGDTVAKENLRNLQRE